MVDLDQLQRLSAFLTVVFLAMAIVGLVGEILGWWNEAGELLVTLGTIGSLVAGLVTAYVGSTKDQVRTVAGGVRKANDSLDTIDGKLGKLDTIDGKLDKLDELDQHTDLLVQIRDRL